MASFSTLTDSFSAGSLNGTVWGTQGDGVTISSGHASINTTSSSYFSGMYTNSTYDLTNASVLFQVISVPTPDSYPPVANMGIGFYQGGGYENLMWGYDMTNLKWVPSWDGGTMTAAPTGAAKWLRIRNAGGSGGSVYWDYSTDGLNWTNAGSQTVAAITTAAGTGLGGVTFDLTSLYLSFYNSEGNSNGSFVIDNVNVAPPVPKSGGLLLFM